MSCLRYYGNEIRFGRIVLRTKKEMKKIYINEKKLFLLLNGNNEEVTFYEFFINTKSFLKDLLKKPYEAEPSDLFKNHGISKNDLIQKMKNIGLIKSNERIDEVPIDEDKKSYPHGTKLVAKHYVKYSIPKNKFEDKIKALYKELFNETYNGTICKKQVFKSTEKLITDILDMDVDNAYKKRGGYDKNVVKEEGEGGATSCGSVMQGGGTNPDARTVYHTVISSPT